MNRGQVAVFFSSSFHWDFTQKIIKILILSSMYAGWKILSITKRFYFANNVLFSYREEKKKKKNSYGKMWKWKDEKRAFDDF